MPPVLIEDGPVRLVGAAGRRFPERSGLPGTPNRCTVMFPVQLGS